LVGGGGGEAFGVEEGNRSAPDLYQVRRQVTALSDEGSTGIGAWRASQDERRLLSGAEVGERRRTRPRLGVIVLSVREWAPVVGTRH
jgi:hypothetical protein